jgi:hypothetical protein
MPSPLRTYVALFAMLLIAAPVGADEIRCSILKIENGRVTFTTGSGKRTFELKEGCTVWMYSRDRTKRKVEEGLKAEVLKDIDEKKGVQAILDVAGRTVLEIWVLDIKKK